MATTSQDYECYCAKNICVASEFLLARKCLSNTNASTWLVDKVHYVAADEVDGMLYWVAFNEIRQATLAGSKEKSFLNGKLNTICLIFHSSAVL